MKKTHKKPEAFTDSFTTADACFYVEVKVPHGEVTEDIEVKIDCGGMIHGDGDLIDVLIEMLEKAKENLAERLGKLTRNRLKAALVAADRQVLRIQSALDEPGARWIERYFLRNKRGRYRELTKIPGNHQYAPGEDEILAWFEKLGVTHVEVAEGWHASVPAKTYRLPTFARHMRRVAKETQG